ncbi:PucR family transcriptional regulator [Bifidobacterium actinocoloniiforme]|nr:helix-turn-helix domain-containing protein [Bifidobacterium actinocoloniiforme]
MSKAGAATGSHPSNRKTAKSTAGASDGEHALWHVLQWHSKGAKSPQDGSPLRTWQRERTDQPGPEEAKPQDLPQPVRRILRQAQDHLGETLPWYQTLSPADKATLDLVIETAVANFVSWQADLTADLDSDDAPRPSLEHIFFIAPLEFTQVVSLRQALDVTRVIVDLLENNVEAFAQKGQERATRDAILYYAREVAFSAAAIYADTAEMRESWNVRAETYAMENLANGVTDSKVASQMAVLGWPGESSCFALVGKPRKGGQLSSSAAASRIRRRVRSIGGLCLVSAHNDLTVVLIDPRDQGGPEEVSAGLLHFFAEDAPVCLGPLRRGVEGASETIRAALTTYQVAPAADDVFAGGGPARPLQADDVLPERVLVGDAAAADQLYRDVYGRLRQSDPHQIMLATLDAFLSCGRSLESAAKRLSVHPNTVRYRLKQSVKITGWDPTNPREAFVLQTALKIGRIRDAATTN